MSMLIYCCMLLASLPQLTPKDGFKAAQLKYPRVRNAYEEREKLLSERLKTAGFRTDSLELMIAAYKTEEILQIWLRKPGQKNYTLFAGLPICAASGNPGPKKQKGDRQVPEGIYHIDRFNPQSSFWLSLGLNYPNAADKKRAGNLDPGGDIFIHGNCVSIGCMAMTDEVIKDIYLLAIESRNNGQQKIPVYIFPCNMASGNYNTLKKNYASDTALLNFWQSLEPIAARVSKGIPQPIKIDKEGRYQCN